MWGLQKLQILFKLMELAVNGVKSVTSSGAIAAVYFGKIKGVSGFGVGFHSETEAGYRNRPERKKKKITLIYRT